MILIKIMIIATAIRMWMKPPIVYELTIPKSHKIIRTTAMM